MAETYFKRKILVIDKQFQYRMIFLFLLSVLVSLLVFSVLVGMYYWAALVNVGAGGDYIILQRFVAQEDGTFIPEVIKGIEAWQFVIFPVFLNNLLIMIVISVYGVKYSHSIAGPVYRMTKDVQAVLEGNLDVRIRLRKGDHFHALADEINLLIDFMAQTKKDCNCKDDEKQDGKKASD